MSSVPLDVSAVGVADASGKALVRLQPLRAFETWKVTNTSVTSTSAVKTPIVKKYIGAESAARFVEGTYTGTFNASDTPTTLQTGVALILVFEGCDVGAICTVTLTGTVER